MTPAVWFQNNDMLISLSGVRSSTMASTAYLNNSTRITATVWRVPSTSSTAYRVVNGQVLAYSTGTNGNYRTVIQSTQHSMAYGVTGLAVLTLNHLGLNGEWRVPFFVDSRRST